MEYREIGKRWKTNKVEYQEYDIIGTDKTISLKSHKYSAQFGDLIKAYVDHLNLPWWKKKWDWDITEKALRTILNKMTLNWIDR
jgi:hypothetical protein